MSANASEGKSPTRASASVATTASVRCSRWAMSHARRSGVVTRQPSTSVLSSGSRRAKFLRSSTRGSSASCRRAWQR